MIKSNGNIKPNSFLTIPVKRNSEFDRGSCQSCLRSKTAIRDLNSVNELSQKFLELEEFKDIIKFIVSDFNDESFYLIKFKGNNIDFDKVEYHYYLIPIEAVFNSFYKTKKRNNLIVELNPNYIFESDYVNKFVKNKTLVIDNKIIPTIIVDSFGPNILIDFHSYINSNLYSKKYTKTNLDVNDYGDGKYPVIIKGSRGNSSHFKYMAHVVIKTHEIGEGVFHKQGYIFDYNSENIFDFEELSFDRILL